MLILALESSCDETAAAVVEGGRRVASNVIATQAELHAEYGGVVPEIASRAHVERLTPVLRRAMRDAGVGFGEVEAVAVGHRPGLIGSLLVGVAAAKGLAWSLGVPLVGVDHVHAHLYAGCLEREPARFPALGLVVSGGHTATFFLRSWLDPRRLGGTIDDAVGEAYDKGGTILGLGYPGGPELDRLAQRGDGSGHDLPISRLGPGSLDFSFSGLKTALLYRVRGRPGPGGVFERDGSELDDGERADLAAAFQHAAVGALLLKLGRALEHVRAGGGDVRTLLVGGGVSANSLLRERLEGFAIEHALDLRLPAMAYCLDNAAMIAGLAHHLAGAGRVADLSLTASPGSELA